MAFRFGNNRPLLLPCTSEFGKKFSQEFEQSEFGSRNWPTTIHVYFRSSSSWCPSWQFWQTWQKWGEDSDTRNTTTTTTTIPYPTMKLNYWCFVEIDLGFPDLLVLRSFDFSLVWHCHEQQWVEFNSSYHIEFQSESYFFSCSPVVQFLRHPEPPPPSSSDLRAAGIRQKPNPLKHKFIINILQCSN